MIPMNIKMVEAKTKRIISENNWCDKLREVDVYSDLDKEIGNGLLMAKIHGYLIVSVTIPIHPMSLPVYVTLLV